MVHKQRLAACSEILATDLVCSTVYTRVYLRATVFLSSLRGQLRCATQPSVGKGNVHGVTWSLTSVMGAGQPIQIDCTNLEYLVRKPSYENIIFVEFVASL